MKYFFFSLLVPVYVVTTVNPSFAGDKSPSSTMQNSSSSPSGGFDTAVEKLLQEQINLITRIERALAQPDPNRVRSANGQIFVQAQAIAAFGKRQDPNFPATCNSLGNTSVNSDITQSLTYCSLYASSQELLKMSPILDRVLSRRGESALVRELPLVSGEQKSDSVLAISSVERPHLGKKATPFAIQEPNLPPSPAALIGQPTKKLLVNYSQPIQAAIAIPQEATVILETAEKYLTQAKAGFPQGSKFHNHRETAAALDKFAYDIDPQEPQTYAKFLELPKTGIFRVLPYAAYQRPLNQLENRLLQTVGERYPFPALAETQEGFTPNLALQLVGERFQILSSGADRYFMTDLGNIPIEKLEANLKTVTPNIREAFLNYQPPKLLHVLQAEQRQLIADKNENNLLSATVPVRLNHTYLVRSLQFQLPEVILNGKQLTSKERLQIDELLKIQSSDNIIAFRPVRKRPDGSYTILWRVVKELSAPQIDDLEAYLQY
ncbi:hypothetical protein NIES4101_54380 [Calothrix sp. NIES-4101]|nr:hypothetical protein NIES4101_54380 [Calothrix sp. NIES-4101]